jgi:hypothetical protein
VPVNVTNTLFGYRVYLAGVCQGQATGPFPLYGDY